MMKALALSTLARLNPIRSALYSVLLLVAGNYNLTANFRISSSGDMRTTPAPLAFLVASPSVCTIYVFFWGSSFSKGYVNSTMKSARSWALIATRADILCRTSQTLWPIG